MPDWLFALLIAFGAMAFGALLAVAVWKLFFAEFYRPR
jgi:hypothetical protein